MGGLAEAPGTSANYDYDPFGRRIRKVVNATETWFLWDGDQLLAEYDGATGDRTVRYAYAGGFAPVHMGVASAPGSEVVFDVHSDRLDTPRLLTDSGQAVTWRAAYEAYGLASLDPGNTVADFNLRFPGQYLDAESGLHYNYFRYYDPAIGRYISADPIGQWGGVNLYAYAGNSPANVTDPSGLWVAKLGRFIGAGAGVGGQAQVTLAVDSSGNVGVSVTVGVGPHYGASAAAGVVTGVSTANTISDEQGGSMVWGASAGPPGVSYGAELSYFGNQEGEAEVGLETQVGAGVGTPEAHGYLSHTEVGFLFNLKDLLRLLFGGADRPDC